MAKVELASKLEMMRERVDQIKKERTEELPLLEEKKDLAMNLTSELRYFQKKIDKITDLTIDN